MAAFWDGVRDLRGVGVGVGVGVEGKGERAVYGEG